MVTSQGRRKTGGGNASGLCRQVFRAALYSAASKSPSPSHTASAPYVFQIRLFSSGATRRARQRTDPRNWISVPCDTTSSGAGNRCFIVEINRLLLGKNPSPVFVNLIFGREQCGEKQGPANGPPHSLPLPREEEPPTGKPISQSARKQALAGNPSNPRSCSDTFHHFRKHSAAQLQSFLSPSLSAQNHFPPERNFYPCNWSPRSCGIVSWGAIGGLPPIRTWASSNAPTATSCNLSLDRTHKQPQPCNFSSAEASSFVLSSFAFTTQTFLRYCKADSILIAFFISVERSVDGHRRGAFQLL